MVLIEILIWTKCWRQLSFQHSIILMIICLFFSCVQNVWSAATVQCTYSAVWSEGGKKKSVTKIHAMAKGTYSTSPIAWRTMYFYLGWISQVTTIRASCISSHRLQEDSLLILNSHTGTNLKHSLLLGLCSMS